jgi:DNA ligase-1
MPDLADGETVEVQGSGSSVYTLKNIGGVFSCTCPAWLHQSLGIEKRTCKHIRAYRGDAAETARLGTADLAGKPARVKKEGEEDDDEKEGPPLLLAHKWEMDIELAGWWMSEKLDGVRAFWDGTQFISRLGNVFHAPDWFIADLPKSPLDGELWGGRKTFQRTVGIVKRHDKPPEWKTLRYLVFDAPKHGGTFEERLVHMRETVGEKLAYARAHPHEVCRDLPHLKEELARVEALGGEGLMLRKPGSKYEAGRSHTLLKVKTFHDAEARVVEHVGGLGKHKGRLGALLVELEDGTRFNVGTGFSDKEREHPPAVGTVITFRYQELSDGGVPRFPSYVGERIDAKFVSNPKPKAPVVQLFPKQAEERRVEAPIEPATTMAHTPKRRFELHDEEQNAFWEIEVIGNKHRVRFGTFELKSKTFETAEEAQKEAEARIADKLDKGFHEVD